jgi:hypothetical protein
MWFQKETAPTVPPAPAATEKLPRFPSVTGSNLNEKVFNLPADFEGERNIILVAYQQWHQTQVDTWMPLVKQLAEKDRSLRFYEIPALDAMPMPARKFIDNGMRSGIPDINTRAVTITLYINKKNFRAWLGLPNEKQIYVLVVDKKGTVLWQSEGAFTEEKGKSLTAYFAAPR